MTAVGVEEAGEQARCVSVKVLRKKLYGWRGKACLVKSGSRYFVVSSAATYSGFETLVFEADKDGKVSSYHDVAGGRGMTRDEALADLTSYLEREAS